MSAILLDDYRAGTTRVQDRTGQDNEIKKSWHEYEYEYYYCFI